MARTFDDVSGSFLQRNSAVVNAPPFSVAAWMRSDDDTTGQTVLSIGDASTDTDYYRLFISGPTAGDPVRWVTRAGGSNAAASTSTGFSANTWHHVAGVEAAANSRAVYIDGGSKGTDSTSKTPSNLDTTAIGKLARLSAAPYFSGDIAWVSIWNAALSDAEIALLANGLHPHQMRPGNLVTFWLDDRSGRHDNDNWGSYDVVASNTPTWADDPPGLQYPQGIVQTDWAQVA